VTFSRRIDFPLMVPAGGANSLESVLTGVIGVIILALVLDLLLLGLGRLTTPRGIRV
jgi:osmoprotectant transport system permease protein